MKLTDNEKRDIIQHIEADRPLPDEYRFLLFDDKRQVELVWGGKTGEVCTAVLPFQTIEQVDEPRAEKDVRAQSDLLDPATGRQMKGWHNKLIWGDNKLILSSLLHGDLRKEIEDEGGLKLIYIDPPFDIGADFTMDIEVGDETLTKEPGVLEQIAYRDTWGVVYARCIRTSLLKNMSAWSAPMPSWILLSRFRPTAWYWSVRPWVRMQNRRRLS